MWRRRTRQVGACKTRGPSSLRGRFELNTAKFDKIISFLLPEPKFELFCVVDTSAKTSTVFQRHPQPMLNVRFLHKHSPSFLWLPVLAQLGLLGRFRSLHVAVAQFLPLFDQHVLVRELFLKQIELQNNLDEITALYFLRSQRQLVSSERNTFTQLECTPTYLWQHSLFVLGV